MLITQKPKENQKEYDETLLNNIQLYSLDEIAPLLENYVKRKDAILIPSNGKIKVSLIKEGCKICNVPFIGGGIIFIDKKSTINQELDELKKSIGNMLFFKYTDINYVFAYAKEERNHPNLSYYSIIGIKSDNMIDLKKAFKIQKLKAFL